MSKGTNTLGTTVGTRKQRREIKIEEEGSENVSEENLGESVSAGEHKNFEDLVVLVFN